HTLRTRQSSLCGRYCIAPSTLDWGIFGSVSALCWCAIGPTAVVSRTADQGAGGSGGRNRRSPPVGAPYGMPLKARMLLSSTTPRIGPAVVVTTGSVIGALLLCLVEPAPGSAVRRRHPGHNAGNSC